MTTNIVSIDGHAYHVKPTGAAGVWLVQPDDATVTPINAPTPKSVAVYFYSKAGVWSCSKCQPTSKDECTHIQAAQAWVKKESRP